jgi:hypothetical protein
VREGDTFFLAKAADRHLWVILSDPEIDEERILFVSLTSHDVTKEDACIVEAGEHPFVHHKTCVYYEDIREASSADLTRIGDAGLLEPQAPVSAELLARIRHGVSLSRDIKYKYIDLLIVQGVID